MESAQQPSKQPGVSTEQSVSRLITTFSLPVSDALEALKNMLQSNVDFVDARFTEPLVNAINQVLSKPAASEIERAKHMQDIVEVNRPTSREDSLLSRLGGFSTKYSNTGSMIGLTVQSQADEIRILVDADSKAARLDIVAGSKTATLARAAGVSSDCWLGWDGHTTGGIDAAVKSFADRGNAFTY